MACTLCLPAGASAQFGPPAGFAQRQQQQQQAQARAAAEQGISLVQARSPQEALRQHRALQAALSALKPGKAGVVEAYVLAVGLDSDAVFGREAAEAARVLARRYGAEGRSMVLAAGTGAGSPAVPDGTPEHLAVALGHIAGLMNASEDVLVLYVTTHGHPTTGLAWRDANKARGDIAPARLAAVLAESGIRNRLLIVSACYSGVFVPVLQNEHTIVMTAASATAPSFGCAPENDWTWFGDALINNALRGPKPVAEAFAEANALVSRWEVKQRLDPSQPQISIGASVMNTWLRVLDARVPREPGVPTGRSSASQSGGS